MVKRSSDEAARGGRLRSLRRTLTRVAAQAERDRIGLVSGGLAFYGLLAVFPLLTALVALYGLIADPVEIRQQIAPFERMLPREGFEILAGQLEQLAASDNRSLGFGLLSSLVLLTWSASAGVQSLIYAIHLAFGEHVSRSYLRLRFLSMALTVAMLLILVVGVAGLALMPHFLGRYSSLLLEILRWPLMAFAGLASISFFYRFRQSRRGKRWRLFTPGSIVAVTLWLIASLFFSWWVGRFGYHSRSYGTLSSVVLLLLWLYLGAFSILLGAEVNAELERERRRAGLERDAPGRSAAGSEES
ncbi:MAG: YihY/virulence factor BrkB family protein [Acidobacteria bacterium]|nr:MAG: YihY/virulence factor BrkB family protein [Acidobacteriota bacterium]REJ99416.1 MAG: YihY/virulence factor BrkB family protein [Acidobacteriota bacterium]